MSNIANTDTARASPIQRRQQDNETHLPGSEAKRDDSYRRRKQREAVRASSTEGKVSVDEPLETQCRCTPSHRQFGRTPSVTPTRHCRATDVRASGSDTTCERGRNAADDPRAEGRGIEIQQTDLRCSRHHKARSAGRTDTKVVCMEVHMYRPLQRPAQANATTACLGSESRG